MEETNIEITCRNEEEYKALQPRILALEAAFLCRRPVEHQGYHWDLASSSTDITIHGVLTYTFTLRPTLDTLP